MVPRAHCTWYGVVRHKVAQIVPPPVTFYQSKYLFAQWIFTIGFDVNSSNVCLLHTNLCALLLKLVELFSGVSKRNPSRDSRWSRWRPSHWDRQPAKQPRGLFRRGLVRCPAAFDLSQEEKCSTRFVQAPSVQTSICQWRCGWLVRELQFGARRFRFGHNASKDTKKESSKKTVCHTKTWKS